LDAYTALEKQLWNRINIAKFEEMYAQQDLTKNEVINLLDYVSYFDLLKMPVPDNAEGITFYLEKDIMIEKQDNGLFAITNLGALLFGKQLRDFDTVARKSLRIIQYKGSDRTETIREDIGRSGYASRFNSMINYLKGLLPAEETIEGAFRNVTMLYPEIVLRELIANALIHQDLSITGAGPTVEIFNGRIEITNPGAPLIDTKRI
jgi:predicted HTH transcriptional regulator